MQFVRALRRFVNLGTQQITDKWVSGYYGNNGYLPVQNTWLYQRQYYYNEVSEQSKKIRNHWF